MTEDLQLKGLAVSTQQAYLTAVQKLARHYGESPTDITEEQLRAYFLHLTQVEHCARGTMQIAQAGVRFCFEVTLHRHWPVLSLIRACRERKLPLVLSRSEVRSILSCVRAPVYRTCLNTIYGCGLRISEGAAVQLGHIDSERKVLRVRGKGNKDRQVPLSEPTLVGLRTFWKLHRSGPWLFPARLQPRSASQVGPVAVDNLRHAFGEALKESGVTKPATVHSLRHSYATHLLEAGVQLRLIQEILGHRSPNTTAIYTHLTAEVNAQLVDPLKALTQNL
ncbi:MAG: tyrosine-type recombinase/integrase [Gammaproteobacteria bacterium]